VLVLFDGRPAGRSMVVASLAFVGNGGGIR
jgi:hypothetical protein